MYENCLYNCEVCGGTKKSDSDREIPACCGRPMKKAAVLEPCPTSETAEHVRSDQILEPCDDGRGRID